MLLIYIILSLLILGSAFFSGSETAVFSLDILKRARISKSKTKKAKIFRILYGNHKELLMTILIGNMLVNIALSSVASNLFHGNAIFAIVSITLFLLIFGEITPKNLSYVFNYTISLFVTRPLLMAHKLFYPLRKLLMLITNPIIKRYTNDNIEDKGLTAEEIKTAVLYGHRQGILGKDETGLISNLLNFSLKEARHIMTPRTRIKALDKATSLKDAITFVKNAGVSKVPIYKKNRDNIVGHLKTKDLLPYIRGIKKANKINHLIHPVLYVPEGKVLADLFTDLKNNTIRMVVVVDEFGGTAGIITLDDLLEEILGQLIDEDEYAEKYFWNTLSGKIQFRGATPLEIVNEEMGLNLSSDDYETLSGYVLELSGDIPEKNDVFFDEWNTFRIKKMDENAIAIIEVEPK